MSGFYVGSGSWTQVFVCGQDFTGGILSLALNKCLKKIDDIEHRLYVDTIFFDALQS